MKKMKYIKILSALVVFLIVFSSFNTVHADTLLQRMRKQMNSFKNQGNNLSINTENVVDSFVELTQLLITIGAGVLVGITIYMGIKYLTSGPEAQAKLKIQLIGIVVAGFVIFGAYFVWRVVLRFFNYIV